MTKSEIFTEFMQRSDAKRASLKKNQSVSREEADAYLEGWRSAWMWAVDILADITTRKEEGDASMKIKITKCNGFGPAFEKMTPGSVHEVVRIDQDEKSGLRAFCVDADGEEFPIWPTECNLLLEGGVK